MGTSSSLLVMLAAGALLATTPAAAASTATASCNRIMPLAFAASSDRCDSEDGRIETVRDGARYAVGTFVTGPCQSLGKGRPQQGAPHQRWRWVNEATHITSERPYRILGGRYEAWPISVDGGCRPLRLKRGLYRASLMREEVVTEWCKPGTGGCGPDSSEEHWAWVVISHIDRNRTARFRAVRPRCRAGAPSSAAGPGVTRTRSSPGAPAMSVVQLPAPRPPPVPSQRPGITVAAESTAATVQLVNREQMYVPWTPTRPCGQAAGEGLRKRTSKRLYLRKGRQPGLRTFDRKNDLGATDSGQSDIRWNGHKVDEVLSYVKETLDSGDPVFVGANEANKVTYKDPKDPSQGLINDGVTDHFLLLYGYRMEFVNGDWAITKLLAIDNAAGSGTEGRYPEFDVRGGKIKKRATCANPDSSVEREYQLTQVRVYEEDLQQARNRDAWWP